MKAIKLFLNFLQIIHQTMFIFLAGIRGSNKTVLLSFIYNELKEKRNGLNMNSNNHVEVFKVRERCNFDTNNFSVYRDRLIKKELLNLALMDL